MADDLIYVYNVPLEPGIRVNFPACDENLIKCHMENTLDGDIMVTEYPNGIRFASLRTATGIIFRCNVELVPIRSGEWGVSEE